MTAAAAEPLLATFETAAAAAGQAEAAVRKRMEAEIAATERDRAFAYRRLNLMRTLARAMAAAETGEIAVGRGLGAVRAELGWEAESESRTETLGRLAPVVRAAFASITQGTHEEPASVDVAGALTLSTASRARPSLQGRDRSLRVPAARGGRHRRHVLGRVPAPA
jgi:hypothetical protein